MLIEVESFWAHGIPGNFQKTQYSSRSLNYLFRKRHVDKADHGLSKDFQMLCYFMNKQLKFCLHGMKYANFVLLVVGTSFNFINLF